MTYRRHEWLEFMSWALALAAVVWWLDGWLSRPTGVPEENRRAVAAQAIDAPDVAITGFEFLHVPPAPLARPEWELRASLAELMESRQLVILHDLRATFTERKEGAVVLTGDRGQLDLRTMDFEVLGESRPLLLQLENQYRLATSRLVWENGPKVLLTDRFVELTGDGLKMTGTGLRWSSADGTLSILQNVETVMTPPT